MINEVFLCGNLTRDPEYKSIPSGVGVVNFDIAVNHIFKDKSGNKKEEVSYFNCEAWDTAADYINKNFSKGDQIFVKGQLKQDRWTHDGKNLSRIKVKVFTFLQMNRKSKSTSTKTESEPEPEKTAESMEPLDMSEIPF